MKRNLCFFFVLNKFFKLNNERIKVLQLAESRNDYFRILNPKYLKKENYFNNRNIYKNFIKSNFGNNLVNNTNCIVIGTNPLSQNFDYLKKLYIKTLLSIKGGKIKVLSKHFKKSKFFPTQT